MTWCSTELDDAVHVHPAYENGHILGPWCWCDPAQENVDGTQMFTHADSLDRTRPADPEDADR